MTTANANTNANAGIKPAAKSAQKAQKPQKSQTAGVQNGTQPSQTDVAIATELAPAVAIALLNKTEHLDGQAAALQPLAAGAVASEVNGKLRVQLLFENGAVLPVELSDKAASALAKGIVKELPKS